MATIDDVYTYLIGTIKPTLDVIVACVARPGATPGDRVIDDSGYIVALLKTLNGNGDPGFYWLMQRTNEVTDATTEIRDGSPGTLRAAVFTTLHAVTDETGGVADQLKQLVQDMDLNDPAIIDPHSIAQRTWDGVHTTVPTVPD